MRLHSGAVRLIQENNQLADENAWLHDVSRKFHDTSTAAHSTATASVPVSPSPSTPAPVTGGHRAPREAGPELPQALHSRIAFPRSPALRAWQQQQPPPPAEAKGLAKGKGRVADRGGSRAPGDVAGAADAPHVLSQENLGDLIGSVELKTADEVHSPRSESDLPSAYAPAGVAAPAPDAPPGLGPVTDAPPGAGPGDAVDALSEAEPAAPPGPTASEDALDPSEAAPAEGEPSGAPREAALAEAGPSSAPLPDAAPQVPPADAPPSEAVATPEALTATPRDMPSETDSLFDSSADSIL